MSEGNAWDCRDCNPTRRRILAAGVLGGLGWSLAHWLSSRAFAAELAASGKKPKALGLIHIYLPGGMAHQESFDPKPLAPLEYRGSFGTIGTKVSGVQFCETVPEIAKVADKLTVIRSMTHGEAAHERGTHNMFTGYRPSPALVFPSIGSIVSHELGSRESLPPYVCIPQLPTPYAGTGYLSSSYGAFSLGSDPASGGFKVRDLALPNGVDDDRFARRKAMLEAANAPFSGHEKADSVLAMNSFYGSAYNLVGTPKAREAFNIGAEPAALRDEYGRNTAGQRLILARRLIEAGVRVVAVSYGGWDFHKGIVPATKQTMPALDKAFAALVNDLDRRGMLDSTLVMLSTEFGRTPKINADAGRDHWPRVFSVVLAGGGVKRGFVYGSSNATAAEPETDPIGPGDLFATVYQLLGVDYTKRLMAPGNRPTAIVREAQARAELVA